MSYNILLNGIGGQGVITLKRILSYASLKEKKNFLASELHGLAQKGGSVNVHFRLGNAFSPLILKKEADLVISLDLLEAARTLDYANPQTIYLVNNFFNPFYQLSKFDEKDFRKVVENEIKKIYLIEASKISREKLGESIYEGVFLLGFGLKKKILPFKENSLIFSLERIFPKKFFEKNLKALKLGEEYGK